MHKLLVAVTVLASSAWAQGSSTTQTPSAGVGLFLNYERWEGMPAAERTAYIMGASDTLLIVAGDERAKVLAWHRHNCIVHRNVSGSGLATGAQAYTESHIRPKAGPVQTALIESSIPSAALQLYSSKMSDPQFSDPTKLPIVLANGPMALTSMGDLIILSFTQALPRIEGQPLGKLAPTEYEFRVVARVGIPQGKIAELFRLVQGLAAANAPPAGSA